jgi:hypothetical protein
MYAVASSDPDIARYSMISRFLDGAHRTQQRDRVSAQLEVAAVADQIRHDLHRLFAFGLHQQEQRVLLAVGAVRLVIGNPLNGSRRDDGGDVCPA